MKQVVLTNQLPVTTPENTSSHMYYGVQILSELTGEPVARGFISATDYYDGTFILRSPNNLTDGNGWDVIPKEHPNWDLKGFLILLVKNPQLQVYEFETFMELMKWVDEGRK